MNFGVLGQLEIGVHDRVVAVGSHRQRSLLALLLINRGAVVSTDRIIDELWGTEAGPDRQNALWVHISSLRSALEPDRAPRSEGTVLRTRSPGYLLDVDRDQVDAGRFEQLLVNGRARLPEHPEQASAILGEALALWRGGAYEEFNYEAFAQDEIARLDELRLEAVEVRIEADLTRGLDGEVVSELEALTRQHPFRERFTAQLMLALHRSGRQADALRAYQDLRSRLGRELGVEPTAELQELETLLLTDHPRVRAHRGGRQSAALQRPGPIAGVAVRGYEIRERIGETAIGVVHRAYQPALGREVAITAIAPDVADDPGFIRRFEGAADAVAALEHPHVVPLYDHWREPGAAYVVTRLMRGGTLADMVAQGPLDHRTTLRMVVQIAEALEAAHRRGVVHGDLQLDSIVFDDDGAAYLADLAVRQVVSEEHHSHREQASPATDVAALAGVAARAMSGPVGQNRPMDAALPAPMVEVFRRAAESGSDGGYTAIAFASELDVALGLGPQGRLPDVDREVANPYRGLSAFQLGDADVFHGRQRVVDRLVARLGQPGPNGRLVTVVGPSGSGKSSVVRAGLLSAIRGGALPGSADWFLTSMTPGPEPFEALEVALRRVAADPPSGLLDRLAAGEHGLRRVARLLLPDDGSQLLIVVDQFEELFTLCDHATATRFLDALVGAVLDDHSRVRVVVTLRADFYDGPLGHQQFGELLREGTEVITPMLADELEDAITRPARPLGIEFAPAVVAEITRDVADRPGALPLLQYALTELFDGRSGPVISVEDYRRIGGASGALAARAESLYAAGDADRQAAAHQVFLRLVTLGEESHDTRRRVLTSELADLPVSRSALDGVLEHFSRHRLLTLDRDPVTRGPTVEISHEALLSEWARLRAWIDDARDDVRNQRRLATAMGEWIAAGRADDHLLSGGGLARLEAWAEQSHLQLGAREADYLSRSVAARDRADRDTRQREADRLAAEGRARRRLRLAAVAAGLAVFIGGLAVVAFLERQAARQSEDELTTIVQAQDLAASSVIELRQDRQLALRLAIAAVQTTVELGTVTPEALDALHWAIQQSNLTYPADESTPVAIRPGPNGTTGVFALPVHDLIELARSADIGSFSAADCDRFFAAAGCPDLDQTIPPDLAILGGDDAYGVVPAGPDSLAGTRVELISDVANTDVGFELELDRFEAETGIVVAAPSLTRNTGAGVELQRRLDDLEASPDFALWPQPGLLAEQELGSMIDLSAYLDLDRVLGDFGTELIAFGTVGVDGDWPAASGALFGLPASLDVKGLVFYPRAQFESAGYRVPESWDELIALSDQLVADGRTPWCFHFGSGPIASGWPGTDLLETLVIRTAGTQVYDDWVRHDIAFDDPAIRAAADRAETLLLTDGYARGGSESISRLHIGEEGLSPLLAEEPGCWLYHQADFMLSNLPAQASLGTDIDIFPFPPIERDDPLPVIGGGSWMSVHADRPEVRAFVGHVSSPEWGARWATTPTSGFVSPNARFDTSAYGADASPGLAEARRTIGDTTRVAIAEDLWRFDASDLMPGEIGSIHEGGPGAFWRAMIDVVDGTRTMPEALADVEATWRRREARGEP